MAYLADFTTKSNAAKATTLVWAATDFPDHIIDDYLIIAVTCEAEVAVAITATAGWTQIGATVGSSTTATGQYSAMFYKKCASTAETCTITLSVTNACHGHAFLISDANTTTFLDGTPSAANVATATSFTSAAITTTQADSLVLWYIGVDSTTTTPTACHSAPGPVHFIDSSDNGGANVTAGSKVMASACAGWYIQRTAGSTPTPTWKTSLTASTNRFTLAIRNKTGGQIPAYIDDNLPLGSQLMQGTYFGTTTYNGESFPSTLTLTQLTGTPSVTTTYDAGALAADGGLNPYSAGINSSPTISTTTVAGFQVIHTSTDMTSGWIVGAVKGSTSKMALYNQGNIKKGGMYMIVGSGTSTTSNYRSFQILGRDNQDGNAVDFTVFSVQPNQTQTQFGVAGAAVPAINAMVRIGFFQRAMQGSGTTSFIFPEVQFIDNPVTLAGGDANFPVNAQGVFDIGRSSRIPLVKKVGANELMAYVPIQVGGGDAVNFQIDSGALQFPRIYSPADKEVNYHGATGAIGISYAGKAGDVIKHTNSVITSPSPYYFDIHSAATTAATWDFTGTTIVKAIVTLRPVMTFTTMSFSNCTSISVSGCTLTDCKVSSPAITNDSLVMTSTTAFTYCSFNTTTLPASGNLTTLRDSTNFQYCTFTGSANNGHAITISTPGTYSFVGNIFNSYGANGTGGAAIVNNSGGSVVLNISGGGNTPTYRNVGGATTTINSSFLLAFSGLQPNSEVRCYTGIDPLTAVEIGGIENSTTDFSFTHSVGGVNGYVVIHALGYQSYRTLITYMNSDQTIPIQQILDRQYLNP